MKVEVENGTRLDRVIEAAVTWPPRAPALTLALGASAIDRMETPQEAMPSVGGPVAMFEKTQVLGDMSQALVVDRIKAVDDIATVAVGKVLPPLQATIGTVPAEGRKKPAGYVTVIALTVELGNAVASVKDTVATATREDAGLEGIR
jgi:hypothetical protein